MSDSDIKKDPIPDKPSATFFDRVVSPTGIAVTVFVIILLSLGAYLYARKSLPLPSLSLRSNKQVNVTLTQTPTPTPTPRPISHGKGSFSVSTDKEGPRMTTVDLDPYDPASGSSMLISVTATNTEVVTSVTAMMETDHKTSQTIPFTLSGGTDKKGTWQGTWMVDDSYLYTYNLKITATSTNGEHYNVLTLR